MKLSEIISVIESFAPPAYQENYDNSGLATGEPGMEITGALLCIDVTLPVIEEAVQLGANLILSHHPVIFNPIKQLTGKNLAERILLESIRKNIAIYSAHTNLDNMITGVNHKICEKLGLLNTAVLVPLQHGLNKLVTFVPKSHADTVRTALFSAGAGHIGNYDSCSFNVEGKGSFRGQEGTSPFVGEVGKHHFEEEVRIETIFPSVITSVLVKALLKAHPYEEVAYDIYPLENQFTRVGSGMIGELEQHMDETDFLQHAKEVFHCQVIRHSKLLGKPLKKIAVCGGSGSFLIPAALSLGADMFLTGEVKYHQFFDASDKIIIADIGHYESEQYTIEIFYDILTKNLSNFAVHFSHINTNPIYYL
jgi:dinuclear metal center YbgI/SA1388 family protein